MTHRKKFEYKRESGSGLYDPLLGTYNSVRVSEMIHR